MERQRLFWHRTDCSSLTVAAVQEKYMKDLFRVRLIHKLFLIWRRIKVAEKDQSTLQYFTIFILVCKIFKRIMLIIVVFHSSHPQG
ncbi:hypothetical protein I3842_14G048500 [Carya illinoinensis]|uniref:Uncharacterized protein n=1 Tax=Carya illinoinensis TaxID=32201 RepID=A0A922D8M1_CARIL|nr:hypothetical protein I3842_14G048500 [Carya illinoinensis]